MPSIVDLVFVCFTRREVDSGSTIGRVKTSIFRWIPWKTLKLSFRSGGRRTLTTRSVNFQQRLALALKKGTVVQFRAILCKMGHLSVIIS